MLSYILSYPNRDWYGAVLPLVWSGNTAGFGHLHAQAFSSLSETGFCILFELYCQWEIFRVYVIFRCGIVCVKPGVFTNSDACHLKENRIRAVPVNSVYCVLWDGFCYLMQL